MHDNQSARTTAATLARLITSLTILGAVILSGLAIATPSASAAFEYPDNGVAFDGRTYYCGGKPVEPSTARRVIGTPGDDVILAMGNRVVAVLGRGGDDIICVMDPGTRADQPDFRSIRIFAGPGDDKIYTPDWDNDEYPLIVTTFGGAGADNIRGGSGWDNIHGGVGHDIMHGGAGYDRLWGGLGRDLFDGGSNGTDAPPGSLQGGDLCNDFEAPMVDMRMECERMGTDPYASPTMPAVPNAEDIQEIPTCGGAFPDSAPGASAFARSADGSDHGDELPRDPEDPGVCPAGISIFR